MFTKLQGMKADEGNAEPSAQENLSTHALKVVLAGESGVGKTTLAHRLSFDACNPCASADGSIPSPHATVGIDLSLCILRRRDARVKVYLWDTAGSESYRDIVPNYFRLSHAVVLVYDCTDRASFLKLSDWLRLARGFQRPGAQLFVVGTKCDLEGQRAVSASEASHFGQAADVRVYETSGLKNIGVVDWMTSMVDAILDNSEASSTLEPLRLTEPPSTRRNIWGCCGMLQPSPPQQQDFEEMESPLVISHGETRPSFRPAAATGALSPRTSGAAASTSQMRPPRLPAAPIPQRKLKPKSEIELVTTSRSDSADSLDIQVKVPKRVIPRYPANN